MSGEKKKIITLMQPNEKDDAALFRMAEAIFINFILSLSRSICQRKSEVHDRNNN
jgi:hypothetical protein